MKEKCQGILTVRNLRGRRRRHRHRFYLMNTFYLKIYMKEEGKQSRRVGLEVGLVRTGVAAAARSIRNEKKSWRLQYNLNNNPHFETTPSKWLETTEDGESEREGAKG